MYTTKTGQKKYRVILTMNGISVDKSGFNTISEARYFILNIDDYITEKVNSQAEVHSHLTFEQYFYVHEKTMTLTGKWSNMTRRNYNANLRKVMPYIGELKLVDITKQDCQNILNDMVKKGYRKGTIKMIRTFVRTMLNFAIRDELITSNKMQLTVMPETTLKPINKFISSDEYAIVKEYVLKNCEIPVKTFFLLCSLGLRKGEALAISKSKLTFLEDGTVKIFINDSVNEFDKDGSGRTKTSQSRFVFGTPEIATTLLECIEYAQGVYDKKNKPFYNKTPIIASKRACTYHTNAMGLIFSKITENTGVKITPHMLRHYFATQSQLKGLPPRLVADFLGHKNITMTEHYSHQTETGTRIVLEQIKGLI